MLAVYTIALVGLVVSVGGYADKDEGTASIRRVESITGYDLPDDMEELYHFRDKTFTGVARQYSVYKVEEEPACISEKRKRNLSEEQREDIIHNLEMMDIPEEQYPNFAQALSYITGKEDTYIIYFPEEQKLIVSIQGH